MEIKTTTENQDFENKEVAITRYKKTKNGEREVITYGNNNNPVEVLISKVKDDTRTFVKFGSAEILVSGGNEDDDIQKCLDDNINLFPEILERYEKIYMSRLELKNVNDKSATPKSYFVITGKIKPQL